jgi:hypothetical protein
MAIDHQLRNIDVDAIRNVAGRHSTSISRRAVQNAALLLTPRALGLMGRHLNRAS